MKPEKYSFKEFYIEPIVNLGKHFLGYFGWWECERCYKFYSPRVKKYRRRVSLIRVDIVCSVCYRELNHAGKDSEKGGTDNEGTTD